MRCWRVGVPRSRSITGKVISTVSRSLCPKCGANYPLVTYVTDGIASAMAQAKSAAGDRNELVHGARTAQRSLEAGVLDELVIHQIPVQFGRARRLIEVLLSRVELEIVRVIDIDRRLRECETCPILARSDCGRSEHRAAQNPRSRRRR